MKLLLGTSLKNRASSTTKDARVLNGFVEVKGERVFVIKRPSLDSAYAAAETSPGSGIAAPATGQALFPITTATGVTGPGTGGASEPGTPGTTALVSIASDVLNNAPALVPSSLTYAVQPSEAGPNTAISPAIVVNVRNKFGLQTTFSGNVTLSFSANPDGGTLSGTLTVAASGGIATFSNVKVDTIGEDFKLLASVAAVRSKESAAFDIAAYLAFQAEPTHTAPNEAISPAVKIKVTGLSGSTLTTFTGNVTVALGDNPGPGVLSGTLTVAAVAGVATFSNLKIDVEADNYTLVASATDMEDVESATFDITTDFIVTAAQDGSTIGYVADNFGVGLDLGSVSKDTPFPAAPNVSLADGWMISDGGFFFDLSLNVNALNGFVITQLNVFTSVTINGYAYTAASSTFVNHSATNKEWKWVGAAIPTAFTAAGDYTVTIA